MLSTFVGEPIGQSWLQFAELGLALLLSALIGLEREMRQKSAGLRTYTLVGVGSALILLISKYGFTNILSEGRIVLDPSRMAAQIVSGIGFIGGGVIFVRKDLVRGLNTAATIWVTSAVGMACGAGLPLLAIAVTAANFVVIFGFPVIERRLPKSRWAPSSLQISYQDGRGLLREILVLCTQQDFAVTRVQVQKEDGGEREPWAKHAGKNRARQSADGAADLAESSESESVRAKGPVTLMLEVRGKRSVAKLVDRLSELDGVASVSASDANLVGD
ncbi:MAG: MgtC/SapB family protein [Bradyrhizobium sp.]|nr:MAG: MgtC/SapB family protein [Bradyrhizobium sp.]